MSEACPARWLVAWQPNGEPVLAHCTLAPDEHSGADSEPVHSHGDDLHWLERDGFHGPAPRHPVEVHKALGSWVPAERAAVAAEAVVLTYDPAAARAARRKAEREHGQTMYDAGLWAGKREAPWPLEFRDGWLQCPVDDCRGEYVHITDVRVGTRGREDGDAMRWTVTASGVVSQEVVPEREAPGRRQWVELYLEGECGHRAAVALVQHKGQTRMDYARAPDSRGDYTMQGAPEWPGPTSAWTSWPTRGVPS